MRIVYRIKNYLGSKLNWYRKDIEKYYDVIIAWKMWKRKCPLRMWSCCGCCLLKFYRPRVPLAFPLPEQNVWLWRGGDGLTGGGGYAVHNPFPPSTTTTKGATIRLAKPTLFCWPLRFRSQDPSRVILGGCCWISSRESYPSLLSCQY